MSDKLKGKKVELIVSDPWEFQSIVKKARFSATIIRFESGVNNRPTLLVQLDDPPFFKKERYEFLIIESALIGWELNKLGQGEHIPCGMIRLTTEQAYSSNPMDTSWWRGGHTLTGTIRLLD